MALIYGYFFNLAGNLILRRSSWSLIDSSVSNSVFGYAETFESVIKTHHISFLILTEIKLLFTVMQKMFYLEPFLYAIRVLLVLLHEVINNEFILTYGYFVRMKL